MSKKTSSKDIVKSILESSIKVEVIPIKTLKKRLLDILTTEFGLLGLGLNRWAKTYLKDLKTNLSCIIEYPYVDRVYRDDYYSYFSTKFNSPPRDTIRISFFENSISLDDFRENIDVNKLQEKYLGFIIIRPTEPQLAGRSVINPRALKKHDFVYCSYDKFETSINGIKLHATGFPHASQNAESMTCAETSLWALMEYFGNKYIAHRPLLPSEIRKILSKQTQERQLPSRGLYSPEMSYTLKKIGFGVRIYDIEKYGEREFNRLMAYHVESGIPIAAGISNVVRDPNTNAIIKRIGHAVLIIGHEELNPYSADRCPRSDKSSTGINIFDTAEVEKDYVIIDDNFPPYQISSFGEPLKYYGDNPTFKGSKIDSFIAPLHSKVYAEAEEARNLSMYILENDTFGFKAKSREIVFRFFLSSSRSFKESILKNHLLPPGIRYLIQKRPMPKFIWVAEITNKEEYKNKKALGLILLDATEPSNNHKKTLLLTLIDGRVIININGDLKKISIKVPPFNMYINNLKSTI